MGRKDWFLYYIRRYSSPLLYVIMTHSPEILNDTFVTAALPGFRYR